ncbi:MAG: hypothetical protein HC853_07790 [Anaerolineae bacterium]|nr:hypothetical protein [Anaerolineae bacterium]
MKLAVGSGLLIGSAALSGNAVKADNGLVELAESYLKLVTDESAAANLQAKVAGLSAEDYLRFYELAANKVAVLADPQEPGAKQKTNTAVALQRRLMAKALSEFSKPVNQLQPAEVLKLTDADIKVAPPTSKGNGQVLFKPLSAPCYNYTYNAYLSFAPGIFPNYINYYAAAGAPNCGDTDLEVLCPGYKSNMHYCTSPGSAYISALRALVSCKS